MLMDLPAAQQSKSHTSRFKGSGSPSDLQTCTYPSSPADPQDIQASKEKNHNKPVGNTKDACNGYTAVVSLQ